MPRRSDLIGSQSDPAERTRVERTYRRLLEALKELRSRLASRRFYQIDLSLGRASGFLTKVFSGREDALTLGRFLTLLDKLGIGLGELALFADMDDAIPRGVPGYLRSLKPARKRSTSPFNALPRILQWGRRLRISSDAPSIDLDATPAAQLANGDAEASSVLAQHALEQVLESRVSSVSSETAAKICHLLSLLGHHHRNTGHRMAALEILDLAFVVEAKIDHPAERALIYRTSAHLLSDLGLLRDALLFAHRSERISSSIGDSDGLGRSLYVKASMYFYRGEYLRAVQGFRASLFSLPAGSLTFRVSAQHAIAYCLLELGQTTEASNEVAALDKLLESDDVQLTPKLRANDLELRANLASLQGRIKAAEQLFQEADATYYSAGAELDRLVLLLRRVQHALRHCDMKQAFGLIEQASPLASRLETNDTVHGVVLEMFRLARAGTLKLDLVEKATRHLLFPGTRITRSST